VKRGRPTPAFIIRRVENLIRDLAKQTVENVIAIGEALCEVKERLAKYKTGSWLAWLKSSFEWTRRTADSYINTRRLFERKLEQGESNVAIVATFRKFDFGALYLMGGPSISHEEFDAAYDRARRDEHITHAKAKQIIEEHK